MIAYYFQPLQQTKGKLGRVRMVQGAGNINMKICFDMGILASIYHDSSEPVGGKGDDE